EGAVAVAQVQPSIFIIRENAGKQQIMVLNDATAGPMGGRPMGKDGGAPMAPMPENKRIGQMYGRGTAGAGMPGGAGFPRTAYQPPMIPSTPPESTPGGSRDLSPSWLPVEKLADQQFRPAQTVRPLRMAVVAASFPYREQLKEFQKK